MNRRWIKYCLLIVLAFVLLWPKAVQAEEISGDFSYMTSGLQQPEGEATASFTYRDSFFSCSSYEVNLDLAAMSIRMAMAGFGVGEQSEPTFLLKLYDRLGFQYSDQTVHYGLPGADSIGFAYAIRHISDEEMLVSVVIRGGNYGDEWAGNFTVGNKETHLGFQTASTIVTAEVRDYLNSLPKQQKISVWVTGYSRGAAVANLVGYELDKMASAGTLGAIQPANIYTYCFECPLTSKNATPTESNAVFNNIFSFVNDTDIVTKVAPGRWGFHRYGITLFLPSAMNCSNFSELRESMLPKFGAYSGCNVYTIDDGQTVYLDRMLEQITNKIGSQKNYEKYLQDFIRKTILGESTVVNKMMDWVLPYVDSFMTNLKDNPSDNSVMSYGMAHAPELCMAWIDTLCEKKELPACANEYEVVVFDGKADIYVYDENLNLVASGDGKDVKVYGNPQIGVAYGMGDEFLLAYPKGGKYYLSCDATKRMHFTLVKSLFDSYVTKDITRIEYSDVLCKKDEGVFVELGTEQVSAYICDAEELPILVAARQRGEAITKEALKPSKENHGDSIIYPEVVLAKEPLPNDNSGPSSPHVVSASKNGKKDYRKTMLFAGCVIFAVFLVILLGTVILRKKKADSKEEEKPYEPASDTEKENEKQ